MDKMLEFTKDFFIDGPDPWLPKMWVWFLHSYLLCGCDLRHDVDENGDEALCDEVWGLYGEGWRQM